MALPVSFSINLKDRFSAIAGRVSRKIKGLKKDADRASISFGRLGKRLGKLAFSLGKKGLFAGAAIATTGLIATIRVGSRFEDAMASLSAITGAAGDDLGFFGDQSRKMAIEFGSSAPEIVTAMKNIASAKSELLKTPSGLIEVTRQAILLEKATGEPLESMANSLVLALNQFNATADESKRFANVLAAGAKVGASEIGFTAEAIKESGVAARIAGIDFEQFNAAIQVVAKGGLKGGRAGTQLKIVFTRLEKQFQLTKKGLIPVLDELAKKNLSVTELTKIFGDEAFQTAEILIAQRKTIKDWTAALTDTNVAQEQANIRMATFSARMSIVKAKIQDALINAFDRMSPKLMELAGRFSDWLSTLKSEDIQTFVDSILVLVNALSKTVQLMAKLISSAKILSESPGLIFEKRSTFIDRTKKLAEQSAEEARKRGTERKDINKKIIEEHIASKKLEGSVDTTLTVKSDPGTSVTNVQTKSAGFARAAAVNIPQPVAL